MEAFSLLKYWRTAGAGGGGGNAGGAVNGLAALSAALPSRHSSRDTTTVATSLLHSGAETDEEESVDGEDEGPFFDLEFAVPEEDESCGDVGSGGGGEREGHDYDGSEAEDDDEEGGEEREFNFTVASDCGGVLQADNDLPLSPSDDLFFKGRLVPLESSSLAFQDSNPNKQHQHQFLPVSLLKSATKFRVFALGLRKPNGGGSSAAEAAAGGSPAGGVAPPSPKHQNQGHHGSKLFTVKFKVEEVPIVSLFTRDNSSRNNGNGKATKRNAATAAVDDVTINSTAEEKKFSKEIVHKYLNKIKPLYVRVSRRYAEKLRFRGQLLPSSAAPATAAAGKQFNSPKKAEHATITEGVDGAPEANPPPPSAASSGDPGKTTTTTQKLTTQLMASHLPTGLRVVCKHLGKSRSASSAVAAVPSPPPVLARRRDDSLLQQQDGIQSAIAHCKRSFNAPRETPTVGSPPLPRSRSDSCDERCGGVDLARACADKCIREDCL